MSDSETERRAHRRLSATFELEGSVDALGTTARMVATNLSLGGVYCMSPADFPEMTRLEVRMMLPMSDDGPERIEPVDVEAVVVRRQTVPSPSGNGDRFRLALFFTRIEDEHRALLSRYLDRSA